MVNRINNGAVKNNFIAEAKNVIRDRIISGVAVMSIATFTAFGAVGGVKQQTAGQNMADITNAVNADYSSTYFTVLFRQTSQPYALVDVGTDPLKTLSNPLRVVADANVLNLKNGTYYFEINPKSNADYNVVWGTTGGVIAVSSTYNRGLEVKVVGHGTVTLEWLHKPALCSSK